MEVTMFGSLYINGSPVVPGYIATNDPVISLGNTVPDRKITWAFNGKMYVANCCACVGVSWDDLNHPQRGPVSPAGKFVTIDNKLYRSWLLTSVATGRFSPPCTWGEFLHDAQTSSVPSLMDGSFWNAEETSFWGQDEMDPGKRIVWGQGKPWESWQMPSNECAFGIGYRPVLEPLHMLELNKKLKGKCLRVYSKDGSAVTGWYEDSDDYDLILKRKFGPSPDCSWAIGDIDTVTVNRSAILWIEKTGR